MAVVSPLPQRSASTPLNICLICTLELRCHLQTGSRTTQAAEGEPGPLMLTHWEKCIHFTSSPFNSR